MPGSRVDGWTNTSRSERRSRTSNRIVDSSVLSPSFVTSSAPESKAARSAPSAVPQTKSAGMIPVNESLFSRLQASRQPSAWERPSKTTSLGRPLSARAMSSSALCTSTAAIPRAASHEEIASGGDPPPGLNTIAVCRCDTLRDAHTGGREVIGDMKRIRTQTILCVASQVAAGRVSGDHL